MDTTPSTAGNTPPKLPTDLFRCYKQYKANTDRVASWLGATAHSLGYTISSSIPTPAPGAHDTKTPKATATSTGRLKGKARKAAAAAAEQSYHQLAQPFIPDFALCDGAPAAPPPTLLNTNQFVQLARFIAAVDAPPVTVPPRIISWACAAIASRRVCAEWFQSGRAEGTVDERSNQTHQHFIGILEQVVDILATRVGKSHPPRNVPAPRPSPPFAPGVELLSNRFSALGIDGGHGTDSPAANSEDLGDDLDDDNDDWDAVDSLVEETLATADRSPSSDKAKSKQHQRYRVQIDDDDAELVVFGHLLELRATRIFIRETWTQCAEGQASLEVAALATVAAMDKMQLAHDALVESFPTVMADTSYMLGVILYRLAESVLGAHGSTATVESWVFDCMLPPFISADEDMNLLDMAFYSIADLIIAACSAIQDKRIGPGSCAELGEKPTDRMGIITWRAILLGRVYSCWKGIEGGRSHDFAIVPMPIVSHLDALLASGIDFSDDASPAIPLSTQFAALVLFDIYDMTRNHPGLIGSSFAHASLPHCHALDQYRIHVAPGSPTARHNLVALKYASDMTNPTTWWSTSDRFHPIRAQIQQLREAAIEVFELHPLLAGLFAVSTHAYTTALAMAMGQHSQYVSAAAYVYWAIKHVGLANHGAGAGGACETDPWSWPLMDELLDLTPNGQGIYYGRLPVTVTDACKALMILLGGNALDAFQAYSVGGGVGAAKGKAKGKRAMKPVQPSAKRMDFRRDPDKFAGGLWRKRDALYPLVYRTMGFKAIAPTTKVWERAVLDGVNRDREPTAAKVLGVATTPLPPGKADSTPTATSGGLKRPRATISIGESFFHLRSQLVSDLPTLTHNVLLLHVQSYRILSHLRARLSNYLAHATHKLGAVLTDEQLATWAAFTLHLLVPKAESLFHWGDSPEQSKRDRDMAMVLLAEVKEMIQQMGSEDVMKGVGELMEE